MIIMDYMLSAKIGQLIWWLSCRLDDRIQG